MSHGRKSNPVIVTVPLSSQVSFPRFVVPSVFMTQGEAEAMVGKDVRVINGPLKGTVGKLVRKQKQYYFLKAFIGLGVMVRISRWYCEPI